MGSIILDCDPGHDDAVALLLALASEEVDLLGVTTVAGNQTLAKTTANALRVLDYVGHGDVPVAAGADRPLVRNLQVADDVHGESGLDGAELPPAVRAAEPDHAIDWMAQALRAAPSGVTLVATGPLTNIALLLARYPEVEGNVERVVMMGGSIGEGNVTPAAEFNFWTDPEAAHRVFSSNLDLTMIGLDVTHRALVGRTQIEALSAAGRVGRLVADLYGFYAPIYTQRYGWEGAPAHDAVAMAYVIDASLLGLERRGVVIDTGSGPSRGRTYVDLWHQTDWAENCRVAVDIDAERFLALLVERVSAMG